MRIKQVRMIECRDWDAVVTATYGRPYAFQQQEGCQGRGIRSLTVPDDDCEEDMNDSIPEIVNGEEMGVKFSTWLVRNPLQLLSSEDNKSQPYQRLELWWHRNFYPDIQSVANDLHSRGLIDAGEYVINIDW